VTDSQAPEPAQKPADANRLNPMAANRRPGKAPAQGVPLQATHSHSEKGTSSGGSSADETHGIARRDGDTLASTERTLASTERLLDEHFDTVFRYAYRLTGSATAADDVAQEVFLRVFRNLHQLRDAGAAKGWLLVITRNEFARWCKKFAPKPSLETLDAAEEPAEPESVAVDREEWVQQSLEQLPLDYRTVVMMFYFEQLSYTEIAQQLQIPLGTVMSRLNRGKSHLKKALTALAEPNA